MCAPCLDRPPLLLPLDHPHFFFGKMELQGLPGVSYTDCIIIDAAFKTFPKNFMHNLESLVQKCTRNVTLGVELNLQDEDMQAIADLVLRYPKIIRLHVDNYLSKPQHYALMRVFYLRAAQGQYVDMPNLPYISEEKCVEYFAKTKSS